MRMEDEKRTSEFVVKLVPIRVLRSHERVIEEHVEELMRQLLRDGRLFYPVLVDEATMVVLDGHHRVEALKRLGARYIPALLVDYSSDVVRVDSWRDGWRVCKEDVIRAGIKGKLLPPKTSRHIVCFDIPRVDTPLHVLLGDEHVPKTRKVGESAQEQGT